MFCIFFSKIVLYFIKKKTFIRNAGVQDSSEQNSFERTIICFSLINSLGFVFLGIFSRISHKCISHLFRVKILLHCYRIKFYVQMMFIYLPPSFTACVITVTLSTSILTISKAKFPTISS
jgi:hypothetical protein